MSSDKGENLETLDGQRFGKAVKFEELVERLARAYVVGEYAVEDGKSLVKGGIRAVLAELAKMGATDLPSGWLLPHGDAPGAAHVILDYVKPILAAKDAELARQAEEIARLREKAWTHAPEPWAKNKYGSLCYDRVTPSKVVARVVLPNADTKNYAFYVSSTSGAPLACGNRATLEEAQKAADDALRAHGMLSKDDDT